MKLDIRFMEGTPEDLWCEALAALAFQESYESQGALFTLNSRTGGYLSLLRESGFFQGTLGSTLLLASEGRVKAEKIVLKGLGPKANCSPEAFMRCVKELGCSLAGLNLRDLAIWMPLPESLERDLSTFFCGACIALLRSYAERHGMDAQFYLKAIFSFPHELIAFTDDIPGQLKEAFHHLESCSVISVRKGQ
jgi:hypothetical protein